MDVEAQPLSQQPLLHRLHVQQQRRLQQGKQPPPSTPQGDRVSLTVKEAAMEKSQKRGADLQTWLFAVRAKSSQDTAVNQPHTGRRDCASTPVEVPGASGVPKQQPDTPTAASAVPYLRIIEENDGTQGPDLQERWIMTARAGQAVMSCLSQHAGAMARAHITSRCSLRGHVIWIVMTTFLHLLSSQAKCISLQCLSSKCIGVKGTVCREQVPLYFAVLRDLCMFGYSSLLALSEVFLAK